MQGAIRNKTPLVAQVRISHSKLNIQPFKNNGLGHNFFPFQFMLGSSGEWSWTGDSLLHLYKLKVAQGLLVGVPKQTQSPYFHVQNSDFPWWTHGLQWRCQDITTQQSNDVVANTKSLVQVPSKTKWVPKVSGWDWSNYPLGFSAVSWALKTHLLLFQGIKDFYPPIYSPHQTPVVQSRGCSR